MRYIDYGSSDLTSVFDEIIANKYADGLPVIRLTLVDFITVYIWPTPEVPGASLDDARQVRRSIFFV